MHNLQIIDIIFVASLKLHFYVCTNTTYNLFLYMCYIYT